LFHLQLPRSGFGCLCHPAVGKPDVGGARALVAISRDVFSSVLVVESCGLVRPVFASSGLLLVCDTDSRQARALALVLLDRVMVLT